MARFTRLIAFALLAGLSGCSVDPLAGMFGGYNSNQRELNELNAANSQSFGGEEWTKATGHR